MAPTLNQLVTAEERHAVTMFRVQALTSSRRQRLLALLHVLEKKNHLNSRPTLALLTPRLKLSVSLFVNTSSGVERVPLADPKYIYFLPAYLSLSQSSVSVQVYFLKLQQNANRLTNISSLLTFSFEFFS